MLHYKNENIINNNIFYTYKTKSASIPKLFTFSRSSKFNFIKLIHSYNAFFLFLVTFATLSILGL